MANICSFSMKVVGSEDNIHTFYNMMTQNGTTYMGRGADVELDYIEERADGRFETVLDGWCKWAVEAAMVENAISMRNEPNLWSFGQSVEKEKLTFITLFEACEQLQLDMEVYSEEPGCEFQEHMLFRNGKLEINDTVEWTEDWDEETGDYISTGGFENWDFEI